MSSYGCGAVGGGLEIEIHILTGCGAVAWEFLSCGERGWMDGWIGAKLSRVQLVGGVIELEAVV